jgi:hypothetical protein
MIMANAKITVSYGDYEESFELDGHELSVDSLGKHSYLSNASKGYIADQVEKALLTAVSA